MTTRFNQKELSIHLCLLLAFLGLSETIGFSGYMRSHASNLRTREHERVIASSPVTARDAQEQIRQLRPSLGDTRQRTENL